MAKLFCLFQLILLGKFMLLFLHRVEKNYPRILVEIFLLMVEEEMQRERDRKVKNRNVKIKKQNEETQLEDGK